MKEDRMARKQAEIELQTVDKIDTTAATLEYVCSRRYSFIPHHGKLVRRCNSVPVQDIRLKKMARLAMIGRFHVERQKFPSSAFQILFFFFFASITRNPFPLCFLWTSSLCARCVHAVEVPTLKLPIPHPCLPCSESPSGYSPTNDRGISK